MQKLTVIQEQRIQELLMIQKSEVQNNFANGELWNETEDKIYFLKTYGQENKPTPIYDVICDTRLYNYLEQQHSLKIKK